MHRSSSLVLAALCGGLAITVSAAGCGKSTSPTTALSADTFLKAYDAAYCTFMVKCGQLPDAASCKVALAADPTMAQAVASVVFGSLMFDPTAAQTCIDSFKTAACDTLIASGPVQKDVATACAAAFPGKGAMGSPCFNGVECTSGQCQITAGCSGNCCPGTCSTTSTAVADGMSCIDPMTMAVLPCVTGDYCSAADKKCEMQAQANATCKEVAGCVSGYSCDTGSMLCFKQSPTGSTCTPTLKGACLSLDDYCDAMKMSCVSLPQAGQPCVMDGKNTNACAADSTCVMGTCTKLPSVGEMCTGACLGQLKCDKNTMKCAPLPETSTCVAD